MGDYVCETRSSGAELRAFYQLQRNCGGYGGRRNADVVQLTRMVSAVRENVYSCKGFWAGLSTTEPSNMEYLLPWQGQLIVPSLISATVHP